jgi:hypothetical protein
LSFAGVAQSVEQLIRNEKVGCSIHLSGTNKNNNLASVTSRGFFVSGPHTSVNQVGILGFNALLFSSTSGNLGLIMNYF